jgi:hypothetical protein
MYSLEEIAAMRQEIIARGLELPDMWCLLTDDDLAQWCNGCGPEKAPEIVRKGLTTCLYRYRVVFMIHDIDYMFSTKEEADARMRRNMLKIWKQDFGIWRYLSKPGLFNRFIVIPAVYSAVRFGGGNAYLKAQKAGGGNGS